MATARRDKYIPFAGGLDLASSPLAMKPGRLTQCLNFEESFGSQGYRGILGYERFDGQTAPSSQNYYVLNFDAGTAAIAVGDTVTGTTATGLVVSVSVTSGSYAGNDAAGVLVLVLVDGEWADNEAIQVSSVTKATANGVSDLGVVGSDDEYETRLIAARNAVRDMIDVVPGSGSVIGVAVYRGDVYAVRNAADGLSAAIYKSSASGWVSVTTGLIPDGTWRFIVANFSANSTTLALFGVDGKNRQFKYDGTTVTKANPIYATEGTSNSNITVGTGSKSFTNSYSISTRSWNAGQDVTVWRRSDAGTFMRGTVTSYDSGTGVLVTNITSTQGSGAHTDWEIGLSDFSDKAFDVTEHKDHMFWAYPLGQLQTSDLGDPMSATTTASLFGLGAELTGIASLRGAVIAAFCRDKIEIISGSSATDWVKAPYAKGAGAVQYTVADNTGNPFFVDNNGVVAFQSTQAFGSFEPAYFSRDIGSFLSTRINSIAGARMHKSSNQYRLYFTDGTMLRFAMLTGNPVPQPRDVSATRQQYNHIPTAFGSGTLNDNSEGLFFGTEDGYVMQEDMGASFDGEEIEFVLRTAFCHYDSVGIKKRFHKLYFELDSADPLTVNFRQMFNFDDGSYGVGSVQQGDVIGKGGIFDDSTFDTFVFDLPLFSKAEANIGGVGENMALLIFIESSTARQFNFQGMRAQFTPLGMQR